jgi:hypothetical protein
MVKQPVEDPKARIPVPGEEPKRVLREARCPSNVAFRKEGFVPLLRSTLPLSTWEISIVSRKIRWWNPISCFNPVL